MRYLRFVVSQNDASSGKRLGVIRAAWRHDEDRLFSAEQSREVQLIFKWFNKYLPRPDRASRNRNANHKNKIALSWFKDSAAAPLQRARRLAELLEVRGVPVEMITTDRPGFVVYEDEFQIVAEPFADTGA